jgi:hypothetical protein
MVVNPDTRQLYIFHGQRHKENLSDFYTYNLHTGQVEDMVRDCSKDGKEGCWRLGPFFVCACR